MGLAKPTTIRLQEENQRKLEDLAVRTKRSRSQLIDRAVERYISDYERYYAELDEAVASIRSDPTYPADQVFDWIKGWGTDEETSFDGHLDEIKKAL
nr:ribbon-helix-helix domain-containing protein [uncultured Cohaesibacter sp.]